MAAWQRRKGADGEREIVTAARSQGLKAERTWQGATHFSADIRAVDVRLGGGLPYQVKRRARAWADLYKAIEYVTGVFFRADNQEWLLAIRPQHYFDLLKKAGLAKDETGDSNIAGDIHTTNFQRPADNVPCEKVDDVHGNH